MINHIINQVARLFADPMLHAMICRLLLAVIFGGLIGIERGRRHRPAGLRTHMLVCLGSALVMVTSEAIAQEYGNIDPTRLGAQVISGIGFLGVGTIIIDHEQQHVRGLTTAAGLWASACMGLALGAGYYAGAVVACVLILVIISTVNKLEYFLTNKSRQLDIYAEFDTLDRTCDFLSDLTEQHIKVYSFEIVHSKNASPNQNGKVATNLSMQLPKQRTQLDVMKYLECAPGPSYLEVI